MLVDRDVGITLKRIYRNVPWWQRFSLFSGLIGSVMSRQDVSKEDIEKLKEGDMLEATFSEFAAESEALYTPLIRERDRYMALRLAEEAPPGRYQNVLVVLGAGHLKGTGEHLEAPLPENPTTERESLEATPPPSKLWKAAPWLITALVITGFVIGFSRNTELGWQLVIEWFLINGILSGGATIAALAHPVTVIATFFAAPLTSLNPAIRCRLCRCGGRTLYAQTEGARLSTLRHDVTELKGSGKFSSFTHAAGVYLGNVSSAVGTSVAGYQDCRCILR